MSIQLHSHQLECLEFFLRVPRGFNHGDPGTGKTISTLAAYNASPNKKRLLVAAPLTILRPSWGADIEKAFPQLSWAVAHGSNVAAARAAAFASNADIVLINHDGVNWIADQLYHNKDFLSDFSHFVVDEYTAFKHRTSLRAKNCFIVAKNIEHLLLLSGTPNSRKITDVWFPAFMADGGQRLGRDFYKFQSQVCTPHQIFGAPNPNAMDWVEKDNARDLVGHLLSDISIRHTLEDCVDIPPNTTRYLYVDMPSVIMRQYKQLEREAVLLIESNTVSAIHAGAKASKILQLLSGAVYGEDDTIVKVHNHRCELVLDLVEAREHSLVAFNWKHQRDALTALARKRLISHAVIDGDVSPDERNRIVEEYQNGKYQTLFCHPQAAGHGLTLTRGTATIWASPTHNAEHFLQFNRRIYRNSQTQATETICICANDTREIDVYEQQSGKLERMSDLLSIFANATKEAA